jgi:hypothetical protein
MARHLTLDLERVNRFLLVKQRLAPGTQGEDVVEVVEEVCALHATAPPTPYLSLWSRVRGYCRQWLDTELYETRRLVRALCMRGTLHIVPSEHLPVFYQATRKRSHGGLSRQVRGLLVQAGLCREGQEAETQEHLQRRVADVLADRGPSTASELSEWVPELGIRIAHDVGKPYAGEFSLGSRFVPWMCVSGLLARGKPRGSWRSNLHEYALLATWLPGIDLESLTPEEAQTRLVRWYLAAYGPVTAEDIAWWSGFGKRQTARALSALGGEVLQVEIRDLEGEHWMLAADHRRLLAAQFAPGPSVALLPALDPYIMGYRDRRRYLAPEHRDRVYDRAGNAFATAWVRGRVVGVWREWDAAIEVLVWEDAEREALADRAGQLGRFLCGQEVEVVVRPYPPGTYVKNPFTLAP